MRTVLVRLVVAVVMLAVAACGADRGAAAGEGRIVVTTSILGDVVAAIVGDAAEVDVIMGPGADPHDFAPSAQQAAAIRDADLLVVNGEGFEASLEDTIEAAEADGVSVVAATDGVDLVAFDERAPHGAEVGPGTSEEPADDHATDDPHFFTDPVLMAQAVEYLADELATEVPGLAGSAFDDRVERYLTELDELHAEVEAAFSAIPPDRRVLVTNHEVLGYLADRYGFELLGAVIPGGTTLAEPSAAGLQALSDVIRDARVPAIFAETSSPARLAEALAAEGTDVEVVELYTESLGEPGSDGATYLGMVRTNAARIAAALAG